MHKHKMLLHTCCAPCLIYPNRKLKLFFPDLNAYFFNPNIYPQKEYDLRLEALKNYADMENLQIIYDNTSDRDDFSKINLNLINNSNERCNFCYDNRLEQTARFGAENNYTHFSTTLLFSKYQKHELIIDIARKKENKYGIIFYYEDFRCGWKEAVEFSRNIGMYRQKYCGCISSFIQREEELKKRLKMKTQCSKQ